VVKALAFLACLFLPASCPGPPDSFEAAREKMVSWQIEGRGVRDPRVLAAMRSVPRHLFVPLPQQASAYEDHPLSIGHGQTISQPYIVALMTELARPGAGDRALEVGTGSGYQAAVLSRLVKEVCTIEIVRPLGEEAAGRLKDLGYSNVRVRIGDGYEGWAEKAPFDIILVTAAPEKVPPPLLEQLKTGGRLVIPVGPVDEIQSLQLIEKDASGRIVIRDMLPVRFVPLTRPR
jgi:protein-L-isoaspartate(D-aspartate) O-methyltransferase